MSTPDNLRILIVDDNKEIHKDFIKILTKNADIEKKLDFFDDQIFGKHTDKVTLPQFMIDTASQGEEGIRYIKDALKHGEAYALAFVDIRMPPGWNGIETIKKIWKLDPDVQIVICTAYSDYSWEETVQQLGQKENLLILKKPFDEIAVRQLAWALTKKWQLLQESRTYTSKLKKQVEDRTLSLQKSLSLVKATLESSNNGILVINNDKKIVDYNKKFVNMWRVPAEILEERNESKLREFMKNQVREPEIFCKNLNTLYEDLEETFLNTIKLKDNKIYEYYSQPQKINGKIVGRVFDFRDVTKRAKFEKILEHQATHDALTGLPNRILLFKKIQHAIKMANKNHDFFALLFLDLDRFKLINDSLSHAVGDQVLQIAADRLKSFLRSDDTLARLGGDEFVIILSNLKKEEHALSKAIKLQDLFHKPFIIGERNITLTASIGISLYPRDGRTPDILLRNADAAMYHAKEQQTEGIQFYTNDLNVQSLAKLDQEIQLRQALKNKELFLYYQPQIDLKTGTIVAVEALLRWQHPKKGLLLPLDFIPLAEETGLIVPMGEWVMRQACQQNKAWQIAGFPPIRVAVNVTAQQFTHQNLPDLIQSILKESGLEPKYLELELTENVLISNTSIIDSISELKKMGVFIAVDDFGIGYSSLSYLKKIPLDRLKIDSSFIQHIHSSRDDEVIIRAVIAIAKNLNLEVLAEGVETEIQLNFLKAHECGDVQGFYFSEPLSVTELEKLFKKNKKTFDKKIQE